MSDGVSTQDEFEAPRETALGFTVYRVRTASPRAANRSLPGFLAAHNVIALNAFHGIARIHY